MAADPPGPTPWRRQPVPAGDRTERQVVVREEPIRDEPVRPRPDIAHDPDDDRAGPPTAPAAAVIAPSATGVHINAVPDSGSDGAGSSGPRRFRARYAVVYDVDGPRVRLGVGWALLVAGAVAYRPARLACLAALYAATAAWAAWQITGASLTRRLAVERWVAAAGAATLPLAAAAFGVRGIGGGLVVFVVIASVAGAIAGSSWRAAVTIAGRTVASGVWVGAAGAALVMTLRYEIGALITLLVLVAVYEASDYIVGSGASNRVEGPLAGIISIAVVTTVVAFLHVPPFEGREAFSFGGLAAVLCPIGQLVGSALLPSADADAPALRRLDSLLVLAPLWAWLVGLLVIGRL